MEELLRYVGSIFDVSVFLIVFISTVLWIRYRRPSNYPPGPTPIPLIGNLHNLNEDMQKSLKDLRQKYGDIFCLSIGSFWVVFVHGIHNLRELLVKHGDATSDRPPVYVFKLEKFKGIVSSSGDIWKHQRTFTLTKLRDFGFGKKSFESNIMEEIDKTLEAIESQKGQPFDGSKIFFHAASNVVMSITVGKRFEYDDPKYRHFLDLINENFTSKGLNGILNFIPSLAMIPGDPFGGQKLQQNYDKVLDFYRAIIQEHKLTFDENNIRDLIDAYLKRIMEQNDSEQEYTEEQLTYVVGELFSAGSETSAMTITWGILFLIRNPDIQTKMRKEIDEVVGLGRLPSMSDKNNLPFCDAVVQETLRLGNIAPLALPHYVTTDIEYNGFTIPKHSIISPVLESVVYDENTFQQSDKFDPERFIDANGKVFGQDSVTSFSLGRRICPGESLARMEIFLFLTSLVQRFELKAPEGDDLNHVKGKLGLTFSPTPFSFRALPRS